VALVIALLVLSLGIHEAAHGWVALKCGDTTARDLGRITLNPIPHIDPVMTILVPAVLYLSGSPIFGGAKPVPVNYYNLRSPLRDMALVAIAGPASNFLLAIFFALSWKCVLQFDVWNTTAVGPTVLLHAVFFNLVLAAFNLLPIPPLDGSRVMTWLLPGGLRDSYVMLERFGLLLVIAALYLVPQVHGFVNETVTVMWHWVDVLTGGTW